MAGNQQKGDVTIYDIAEALDVSASTVSRSLNDNPSISKKTIQKVKREARKMGYRYNIFAQNLARKETRVIGVIVPTLRSYFMSSAISGMEKVANKNNYKIIISQSHETASKETANVNTMLEQRVDGLIVSLAYNTTDLSCFDAVTKRAIPLIFFDRVSHLSNSTNVIIDNYQAAHENVSHLIEEGSSRIVHLTGNLSRNVYSNRLEGYRQALHDKGLCYSEDLVIVSDLREEDGRRAAQKILEMDPLPDGIFASNDISAASCMAYLKKSDIQIPKDVAITGFNNDPISRLVDPQLTTVNYDGHQMGEVVAQNMITHLKGEDHMSVTNSIILKSELITRESSLKSKYS